LAIFSPVCMWFDSRHGGASCRLQVSLESAIMKSKPLTPITAANDCCAVIRLSGISTKTTTTG
jgi:hypothetical protein